MNEHIRQLYKKYQLSETDPSRPSITPLLEEYLARTCNAFQKTPDAFAEADITILDIGCGSRTSRDPSTASDFEDMTPTRMFEPWGGRLLNQLGVNVIGIDQGEQAAELFPIHQLDISKADALHILPDHIADGIVMSRVLGSPEMMMNTTRDERLALRDNLRVEFDRLLKSEGVIIYSDTNNSFIF